MSDPIVAMKPFWSLLRKTFDEWWKARAPRLGAALAYYTAFSLAPLLVVVIAITGLVLGEEAARSSILDQVSSVVGERSTSAIEEMIEHAQQPRTGIVATVVGIVTLLLGAGGVFGQLQDALNTVWGVEPKPGRGLFNTIKTRFLSLVAVVGTGFLLLVSLVLSAWISAAGKALYSVLPGPEVLLQIINFVVSLGATTLLFAMIYKVLPDVILQWRDVWIGAAVTAFLFTVGKLLLGLYLGKGDVTSGFGAAGSFMLILVWVYYSAQILLFGAEFTAVYSNEYGSHVRPSETAVLVSDELKAAQGIKTSVRAAK